MKRGLIDVSSVIWTCLFAGKDKMGSEVATPDGKTKWVNTGPYGYENAIDHVIKAMNYIGLTPKDIILVVEGRDTKAVRKRLLPEYKNGREHLKEEYDSFTAAKESFVKALLDVGAQVCWQDKVEGDDIIGALAHRLHGERWVISGDKDLAQLVGPGPNDKLTVEGRAAEATGARGLRMVPEAWTGYIHHYRRGEVDLNPFGAFEHRHIPVAIALIGDTVDKIPGAKGFGEGMFNKLVNLFGLEGLDLMEDLIKRRQLHRLVEDVAEFKPLQKIIDSADSVYRSYACGCLLTNRVDTVDNALHWRVGRVAQASECADERLRQWAGRMTVISAENYDTALPRLQRQLATSPFVTLDIETSTPPESDEWLLALNKDKGKEPVDVMGSELTSLQLTFGPNLQFTVYLPVDNVETPGCTNLTIDQVRAVVEMIPKEKYIYVHNAGGFELPVLYNTWGDKWKDDPEWHGLLPNTLCTAQGASYVNENLPVGLKQLSKRLMKHEQVSYQSVTTKTYKFSDWVPLGRWQQKGRVIRIWNEAGQAAAVSSMSMFDGVPETEDDGTPLSDAASDTGEEKTGEGVVQLGGDAIENPTWVTVQRKMNELTAQEVLDYGADDTICTAALALHNRVVMEFEGTWEVYLEVEQLPAYVTAKAFCDGVPFDLDAMVKLRRADAKAHAKAWGTLRDYLIKTGAKGTVCPAFAAWDAPSIKSALTLVTGHELKTQVRTPDKLLKLIRLAVEDGEVEEEDRALTFVAAVEADIAAGVTKLGMEMVKRYFEGEPVLNLGSPKQVSALLYDQMGLPVRVINKLTAANITKWPEMKSAIYRFNDVREEKEGAELLEGDVELLRLKARTDDVAIDTALAFDNLTDEVRAALESIRVLKTVATRESLFYKNYFPIKHWKTGLVHPSLRQSAAATRRYTAANPNIQQMPKKGEGKVLRRVVVAHKRNAVVCSIDFTGQELRLAAERSQDTNMLACYVGDNLRDIHSMTAAFAMPLMWGEDLTAQFMVMFGSDIPEGEWKPYSTFVRMLKGVQPVELNLDTKELSKLRKLAEDLRKNSKNVNFTAQFGGQALKVAETLIMRISDARAFLDARAAMFPGVDLAAKRAERLAQDQGYVTTLMGARRHLRHSVNSDDRATASRASRQAWNFEIQGSAAEMAKLALSRLWKSGALFRYDVRFYFPVHDEFVTSVTAEHAQDFIREKHACMVAPYADMKVPILASISLGRNFADQIECGDWLIPERIEEALKQVEKEVEDLAREEELV